VTPDNPLSRRRVLQGTGALTTGALAGCLGFLPGSQPTIIDDITFRERKVVVHLNDETNADAIDFRSPSGELLATASIGRKSQVEFSLFRSISDTPRSPGEYSLVAVKTNGNGESQRISTRPLKLTSSFAVSDVRPVTNPAEGGTYPFDAKVQIMITNTGTLPIYIDYIALTNGVPNPHPPPSEADEREGNFQVVAGEIAPIPIGATATFESYSAPLWTKGATPGNGSVGVPNEGASWKEITAKYCNGQQHPATLVVIPQQGAPHRRTVTFKYGGKAVRKQTFNTEYGCTNVTVVSMGRKNTSTSTSQ
jgi:hypothetical protein